MKKWLIVMVLILLAACQNQEKNGIAEPVLNWEGYNYIVTNEPLNPFDIAEEIGKIEVQKNELPSNHQEGYKLQRGTSIYKIKNKDITNDIDSVMAVEIAGEYKVARMLMNNQ
ncbi:hypothetical protein [Lysinibacillus sp. ZYM-1]|uniref:hypothetical protein n=1 Tax=Lysinibacillus sp. ZYM-1 TaxID=1681184 RepID=UPI0006CE7331|nr:hypothetical protein [Lysinibacillus sp. ZYM-1]KPN96319.1 hypothetical protein AO843_17170 [Lysinibacillus sp. ZYM-1]